MHPRRALLIGLTGSWLAAVLAANDYPVQPVPFTAVHVTGGLWQARQEVNRAVTIPFALQQCEATGRLRNFDLAAETMHRRAAGETHFQNQPATQTPFDDSDVYKVIEYGLPIASDLFRGGISLGGQTHELVFPGIDPKPAVIGKCRI